MKKGEKKSEKTYILKVPAIGKFTREEFRADDCLRQLQKAVGGYIECIPFNFGCGIDCFCDEEGLVKGGNIVINPSVSHISGMPIVGDVVFVANYANGETMGLTVEQCEKLERLLTTRRREPDQDDESRNGAVK